MKSIRIIVLTVIILLFSSAFAFSEGFFARPGEILFADKCPEGYLEIGEKLLLGVGETRAIANEAKYFASYNHNIVSVDNDGVLRAVSRGKTTICVYFEYNVRKDLIVEVTSAPKSIKLSEKKGTLEIGDTHPLKAVLPKSTNASITWSSSDAGVVSVDDTGLLTALAAGECVITAETHNGLTAECAVTVKKPAPAKIHIASGKMTLYEGESAPVPYTLEGGYHETLQWSSSNPSAATVDENGVVTAVNVGKTTVSIKASGGAVQSVSVTVKEGSTSVSFPTSEITLYVGGRTIFEPIIKGGSGKYEYVSMDTSIAEIDPETGEICAKRAGSVYILAITPNYIFGEFLLNIVEGPQEVAFTAEKNEILLGEVVSTFHNLDGYEPQFTWYESTDNDIAHVDEYGVITGISKGTAVVSIHSGGLVSEINVTVLPPAKGIKAWASKDKLGVGESAEASFTLLEGAGTVRYESSDRSVAEIDAATGMISALSPGTCKITLSVSKGVSASFPITVSPAPESVSIQKSSYTLTPFNRAAFSFTVNEGAQTAYAVLSSDPQLVWYEDGFLYCGERTGSANVTVKTHNGLSAVSSVNVVEESEIIVSAEKLAVSPHFDYYVILPKNAKHELNASVPSAPDIEFFYSSSHPDIADVDETGLITTSKKGTSVITASLYSGQKVFVLVSVE
ncbi:MAG: Ig-like domain-containing protein [Clostridia bacterium]|nr:Ig-like domain-containing protein [Clostridia bacterium]